MANLINLYHSHCRNFGDALSPLLVERLTGQSIVGTPFETANLVAVGSVLFSGSNLFSECYPLTTKQGIRSQLAAFMGRRAPVLHIWGTGFLAPRPAEKPLVRRRVKLLATRGKLTRDVLISQGVVPADTKCVLGDPGLLYKELLPNRPEVVYDVGLIPHMADRVIASYVYEKIAQTGRRVKYIHVEDDPIQVLTDIASCEKILSSSLHGLIVADSLGIPNAHMLLSYLGLDENDFLFKFRDYYSAFGMDAPTVIGLKSVLESTNDALEGLHDRRVVSSDRVADIVGHLEQCLVHEFGNN